MYSSFDFVSLGEVISQMMIEANKEKSSFRGDYNSPEFHSICLEHMEIPWKVGNYFSQQPSFSVCLPTGGSVRLSKHFLSFTDIERDETRNFHPCLKRAEYYIWTKYIKALIDDKAEDIKQTYGAEGFDGIPEENREEYLNNIIYLAKLKGIMSRFEPLVGGSIQILKKHAPKQLSDLRISCDTSDRAEPDIISEILRYSDLGERRDSIRELVCPGMPIEAWRTLWKEAAKIKPEISKSGPKPIQFGS